jgi:Tol biopolymer transport system component
MLGRLLVAIAFAGTLVLASPTPAGAAFPGSNGKIAFESNRDVGGTALEIYTMNPDGSEVRRLTFTRFNRFPAWSPDGGRIVFSCTYSAACVMNADGSDYHQIAQPPGGFLLPSWSPDGRKIAYESIGSGGAWDIWTMDADGSDQVDVTASPGDDFNPAWSPDGSLIAFDSKRDNFDFEVYVMRPDGSGQTRLTSRPGLDYEQEWLPSGDRLAFTSDRLFGGSTAFRIYTMKPDGTDLVSVGPGSLPAWAPDGSQLAFYGNDGDVYTMKADGTGVAKLTGNPAFDYNPSWQPLPNRPPDCSGVSATPASLWPPNHKLVTTTLDGATDPDGDQVTLMVDGITQDEPLRGPYDARLGAGRIRLRADRNPRLDGRVYRIAFTVSDDRGGECSGVETVEVRRQRNRQAVDSAPPSYNSFGE